MYHCPKCGRDGIYWDGRAKVFVCPWLNCNHVVRVPESWKEGPGPNDEQIRLALDGPQGNQLYDKRMYLLRRREILQEEIRGIEKTLDFTLFTCEHPRKLCKVVGGMVGYWACDVCGQIFHWDESKPWPQG